MTISSYIEKHCSAMWGNCISKEGHKQGPMKNVCPDFEILVFQNRGCWIYQTSGMSTTNSQRRLEIHLRSWVRGADNVFLLSVLAHYHLTGANLGVGHSVNFGKLWQDKGSCTHGLLSFPYLDGPKYEKSALKELDGIQFLWLLPITEKELEFKKKYGVESLEMEFEKKGGDFLYMDCNRKSVV